METSDYSINKNTGLFTLIPSYLYYNTILNWVFRTDADSIRTTGFDSLVELNNLLPLVIVVILVGAILGLVFSTFARNKIGSDVAEV
jgi:hypothetical protein